MTTFSEATRPRGPEHVPLREDRRFVLASLSIGHAVTHYLGYGFTVILPYIQNHMGFGGFRYGLLLSFRPLASGSAYIPMGFMVDMLRQYWGLIFTGCLLLGALTFFTAGLSPNYWVLLIAAAFMALPGTVWHLPAFAILSQRYPEKRGFAVSTHGAGGNVGGALGPLLAGALVWALIANEGSGQWRYVLFIFGGPALLLSLPAFWALRDVGRDGEPERQGMLSSRIRDAAQMMRRPSILAITLVLMLSGIGWDVLYDWSPKYLSQSADQNPFMVGFDIALYIGLGIIFGPMLGSLSDRIGRRQVIIPGLLITALLVLAVVQVGSNPLLLALVFAALGPFSHSLNHLLQASVLDIVGRGTEATSLGLVLGVQSLFGTGSPLLVGYLSDILGMEFLFYYAAAIFAIAMMFLFLVPIRGGEVVPAVAKAEEGS